MSALFALEIYLGSLFYGVFCTKKPPLRAWAHEKGTIEEPFVNNRGYHVRPVFTLAGGEGR